MTFSQQQRDQATEHQYITALTEKLIGVLSEGKAISSTHKVYHTDQYMTAGSIYFEDGDHWVVFGEDGNAENFEGAIRNAFHCKGSDYDTAEIAYRAVRQSSDRAGKVKEIKNYFNGHTGGLFNGSIIWVS
jgi:hypothetical protein